MKITDTLKNYTLKAVEVEIRKKDDKLFVPKTGKSFTELVVVKTVGEGDNEFPAGSLFLVRREGLLDHITINKERIFFVPYASIIASIELDDDEVTVSPEEIEYKTIEPVKKGVF